MFWEHLIFGSGFLSEEVVTLVGVDDFGNFEFALSNDEDRVAFVTLSTD